MDDAHDSATAQDPRGLPALPRHHPQPAAHRLTHVVVTGEPGARKPARRVREGDVGKGPKGTSPTSYLALWDAEFGPAFIKIASYFPYPAKVGQRPRMGQAAVREGRDRVHRTVQRAVS